MRLFNEKANKLRRSSFAREMFTGSTGATLSWTEGEVEPSGQVRGPGEESVDAMILTLRLMEQNNDIHSLARMAELYERLPVLSPHKTNFLDARKKINEALDRETTPGMVHKRVDPQTGQVVKEERLTNRRVLDLIIYGERAHTNAEKAETVRSLRSWAAGSAILDMVFHGAAARFLDGIFYLQQTNAALYEELTGEKLPIDWPKGPVSTR